eukprot:Hpha_TRINITY_DN31006_c0_g1::TRINITY_DN31006_c0_g1_i1::g.64056::m.64056
MHRLRAVQAHLQRGVSSAAQQPGPLTPATATRLRELATEQPRWTMLCGVVENIHNPELYESYARRNGTIFAPWAKTFSILVRAYTREFKNFALIHASAPTDGRPPGVWGVDRMPVLVSNGPGALNWLVSDEYLNFETGNLGTRHKAASHTQLFLLHSDSNSGDAAALATAAGSDCAYVLVELWEGKHQSVAPLIHALGESGLKCLMASGECSHSQAGWRPNLEVVEGTCSGLALFHAPDWAIVSAASKSASATSAIKSLEAAGGRVRVIGFQR